MLRLYNTKKKEIEETEDNFEEYEEFPTVEQPDAEMTNRLKSKLAIANELERHSQQSRQSLLNWYFLHFPEFKEFLYQRGYFFQITSEQENGQTHNFEEGDELSQFTAIPFPSIDDSYYSFKKDNFRTEEMEVSFNESQDFFLKLVASVGFRDDFTK